MNLPDLGEPTEGNNFLANLLKKRKLEGEVGPLDYELSRKGLKLNGAYDNAIAELMLRFNGNWNFNAESPLWGGNLRLEASDGDEGRKYGLQYQKQF